MLLNTTTPSFCSAALVSITCEEVIVIGNFVVDGRREDDVVVADLDRRAERAAGHVAGVTLGEVGELQRLRAS